MLFGAGAGCCGCQSSGDPTTVLYSLLRGDSRRVSEAEPPVSDDLSPVGILGSVAVMVDEGDVPPVRLPSYPLVP